MKNRILKMLTVILLAVIAVSAFSLASFAEGDEVPTDTPENATEGENTPSGDVVEDAESTDWYKSIVNTVTNAQFWVALGTSLVSILAVFGVLSSGITKIKNAFGLMIDGKATPSDVAKVVKENSNTMIEEFNKKFVEYSALIEKQEETEKKLTTVIALLISNSKNISPAAKGELMSLMTGIRDTSGTVSEILASVNESISKANETEEKIPTPALDALKEAQESASKVNEIADAAIKEADTYIPLG